MRKKKRSRSRTEPNDHWYNREQITYINAIKERYLIHLNLLQRTSTGLTRFNKAWMHHHGRHAPSPPLLPPTLYVRSFPAVEKNPQRNDQQNRLLRKGSVGMMGTIANYGSSYLAFSALNCSRWRRYLCQPCNDSPS